MRRLVSAALLVFLTGVTCLALAGDLNGRWEGKVKKGQMETTYRSPLRSRWMARN
jgi:hypothetical protein